MDAEQIGPDWAALRHAQVLAALHNGPLKKPGGALFSPADFMRADPWAPPPPADPSADLFRLIDDFYGE